MLKEVGKRFLQQRGFSIRRIQSAGTTNRPMGHTVSVLEDLRARGFVPKLIFDCGASDGAWTRLVRPIFPQARTILIEPRPVMRADLDAQQQTDPLCTVVAAAVGAHEGTGTLTDWDTGSTLLPVESSDTNNWAVPIVTLQALASQYGTPDVVKMDIEGFELEALRGAGTLLGDTELFIVEVALLRFGQRPIFHEVVAFMAAHGYVAYDFGDAIRRPFDGALSLIDICFARSNGYLRRADGEWHQAE